MHALKSPTDWDPIVLGILMALCWVLVLMFPAGCTAMKIPQGPAHTRGALDPPKVLKLASLCYSVNGHKVYAYKVECPDRSALVLEWALWVTRMNEHTKVVDGWKTVFVGERMWGTSSTTPGTVHGTTRTDLHAVFVNVNVYTRTIKLKPLRIEKRPIAWENWGHELCHAALMNKGRKGWHTYYPKFTRRGIVWQMEPRENWLYGVCSNASTDQPRLRHPLTSGRYP